METKLFWPIPRFLLNSKDINVNQVHRLRSLITYQILFGGKLVLRDSDYLNCLALRSAIRKCLTKRNPTEHDKYIYALIDEGLLKLAFRKEETFGGTNENLNNREAGSSIIPQDWFFKDAIDVKHLESSSNVLAHAEHYSLTEARDYYTSNVLNILSRGVDGLDDGFTNVVADCIREHVESHGSISWRFLSEEGKIWGYLPSYKNKIRVEKLYLVVGQAPHAGFIPEALRINPIYMKDVAKAIDVWRGRDRQRRDIVEQRTINLGEGFSFGDFVEYLSALPLDSVIKLLSSQERVEFSNSRSLFAQREGSIEEVVETYKAYRRVVDEEILRFEFAPTKQERKENVSAFRREASGELVEEGVDLVWEAAGASVPFWKLGLSFMHRIVTGEWLSEKQKRTCRQETTKDFASEIHRLQNDNDIIKSNISVDGNGAQDQLVEMKFKSSEDICV